MTYTQQRIQLAIEQDTAQILRLVVEVRARLERSDAAVLGRLDRLDVIASRLEVSDERSRSRLDAIASRLEVAEESLRSRLDVIASRLEVLEERLIRQEDATPNDLNDW